MTGVLPRVRKGIRKTFSSSSDKAGRNSKSLREKLSRTKSEKDKPDASGDEGSKRNPYCASQSTCSLTEGDADWIVRKTETRVAETVAKSQFIQKNCKLYKLPRFSHDDLELGECLANGGFCEVREIKSFINGGQELERSIVEPKRYVIKHLAPKLVSKPKQLSIGAKDLVMEGFVLSSLSHENILEVKGFASSGVSGYASTGRIDGFFLLLPRLDKTLHKQLHEWRVAVKRQQRMLTRSGSNVSGEGESLAYEDVSASVTASSWSGYDDSHSGEGDDSEDSDFDPENFPFFTPRIQTAVEIASAIAYCHRNRILYRDIKPANIGYCFDEDRVKLFDFGLAVELPPSNDPDAVFKLPGNTGTARYMAPEVVLAQHYGLKADVFSFCMLLHEIMALVKPFDKLIGKEVKEQVAILGRRPVIDRSWPVGIRRLLRRGFSDVPEIRPTMENIQDILEDVVDSY